ncbi:polysaccharide pyruvyl transferase family protein [Aestuariivivens sediminicola]|uniref:polysaccharide pyruvyl transferase family protein n=1 Tax=Aestuariivivens sediminicola TaxID=2913560 RepID=UPI001F58926C|nr:polysaccharide pyruvyl transferase family protein [Aestuariivivens sediminicola]
MKSTIDKILRKIYFRFFKVSKANNSLLPKELPQIVDFPSKNESHKIIHISAFNYGNAGDALLPIALQDTWSHILPTLCWKNKAVYPVVDDQLINQINDTNGVVIGGGGLFLKDTNANDKSGWQWPCSVEMLKKIKRPVVIYAVGYNRFRGQEEFEPYFKENITAFAKKSCYIGLRNTGSIEAIKNYIPEDLHHKLRFQPCMTTFLSKLYPDLADYNQKEDFVAINTAFDRSHLRFGKNIGVILSNTAKMLKDISKNIPIKFYSHMQTDEAILPFLQSFGVKYELVKLSHVHPKKIIEEYSRPKLVVGMRGHAQMIPFGCKTPIVSIISHDKLQWFLDDIGRPNWGVDVLSSTYSKDLQSRILNSLENTQNEIEYISRKQKELYHTSLKNVKDALEKMHLN